MLLRPVRPFLLLFTLLASTALPLAGQSLTAASLAGSWVGDLKVGAITLRIVFNLASSGGALAATMDSPDQGATGIPVSRVDLNDDRIRLEVKAAAGSYAGTIAADGMSIDGSWSQGGKSFPVVLKKLEGAFTLQRPQEPQPPFPYTIQEVSFPSARGSVTLAGTLTVPAGRGPFPAVVLVTGSGPQNRDEELMGHRPFRVIADYLGRNGIAVLRYDDRGVGKSKGDFEEATTYDFADDAEAAFSFLAARPEVDARRVGIAGHSEGGLIAPIVAARSPAVDFIILLAGPGIRGDKLLLLQNGAIMRAAGAGEAQIASATALNRTLYDIAARENDPARIAAAGRKAMEDAIDAEPALTEAARADARKGIDQTLAELTAPWFRTYLGIDPAEYLSKVHVPVLALNGTRDLQVPADEDLSGIESALQAAGNRSYRLVRLEGLNHLFQHAGSGLPEEYGKLTETFAPEALAAMRDFILGTTAQYSPK